jgi:PAP2 superfamily protein
MLRAVREIALVGGLFVLYKLGRALATGHEELARTHARSVHRLEAVLHLPSEAHLQALLPTGALHAANYYYVGVHFPLTLAFLAWGLLRRPAAEYRWARNLLIVQTLSALVIHMAYPLAPPRMFPQWGFVDTMTTLGPSAYAGASGAVANQYAAMPSLHIGWAVLIAVVLWRTAPRRLGWVGAAHAGLTVAVVVVTANHWWVDGLVAVVLLAVALAVVPAPSLQAPSGRADDLLDAASSEGVVSWQPSSIGSAGSHTAGAGWSWLPGR